MFKLLQSIALIYLSFYVILLKHLEIIGKTVYKIKREFIHFGFGRPIFLTKSIFFVSTLYKKIV